QTDLGVDGLDDRVLRERGRDEGDRHVGAGLLDGLGDRAEDGQLDVVAVGVDVLDRRAGLAGVDAADDVGAGLEHEGGVLRALTARDALDDDLGVGVQIDRHVFVPYAFASSAALSAAPSMVSTSVTSGWLSSLRIARPSSTLLPSRRTTSGFLASSPRISSAP